jgi:hypothetical protein
MGKINKPPCKKRHVKLEQLSLILSILIPMIDNIILGQATTKLNSNEPLRIGMMVKCEYNRGCSK